MNSVLTTFALQEPMWRPRLDRRDLLRLGQYLRCPEPVVFAVSSWQPGDHHGAGPFFYPHHHQQLQPPD